MTPTRSGLFLFLKRPLSAMKRVRAFQCFLLTSHVSRLTSHVSRFGKLSATSLLLTFHVSLLAFLVFSCKSRAIDPPTPPSVALEVVDIGLTDIWLKVILTDNQEPRGIELKRDGGTISTFSLVANDTVVVDSGLELNRTYQYQAIRMRSERTDASEVLSVTTLDTTSHDFIWQTFTLGEGSSSVLNDVAIIDENHVVAVGEIYLKDSTGQFIYPLYNMAEWDGTQWTLKRVTVNFRGNMITPALEGIFAFSSTDIWLVGSLPIHGDGQSWTMYDLRSMAGFETVSLSKAWGQDSSSMYFVGRGGSIVRYADGTWQKLESGTDIDLTDIWGTAANNVWITGLDQVTGQKSILLHFNGTIFRKAYEYASSSAEERTDSLTGILTSVWAKSPDVIWVCDGGRIWRLPASTQGEGKVSFAPSFPTGFLERLRGSQSNNVFAVGHFGTLLHFNGSTWHYYPELADYVSGRLLRSLAVSDRIVVAVGSSAGRGIVVVGRQ